MATYNPQNHTPIDKPMGEGAFPLDGKFMFYTNGEGGIFSYRPFIDLNEVILYFPLGSGYRKGSFEILVNFGGTLSTDGGSISGGTNTVYWWANGVLDIDLVPKTISSSTYTSTPSNETFIII